MRRRSLLAVLGTSGCLAGADPRAWTPPFQEPIDPPTLTETPRVLAPAPAADGVPYGRAGTEVVVELTLQAPIRLDPPTDIRLDGLPMDCAQPTPDVAVYQCRRTLLDTDGNGARGLTGILADTDEPPRTTRLATPPVITLDFQAPQGACLLTPRVATATDAVTFTVTPSERLPEPPTVTADVDALAVAYVDEQEGQHRYAVRAAEGVNVDGYQLTVVAADFAGNPQPGDSLCDAETRTGAVLGRGPALPAGEDVVVRGAPSTTADGALWVRDGSVVSVEIPTADPIDVARSTVTLTGLPTTYDAAQSTPLRHVWTLAVDGATGDGAKDLDARLIDLAGNALKLVRRDVVRIDTVSPEADCVLQPRDASAVDPVTLKVFLSEPVTGGAPTVVADNPGVEVGTPNTAGTEHQFPIRATAEADLPYTLTVTATDRAGNAQVGDSLCAAPTREGRIVSTVPVVVGDPTLTAEPAPGDPRVNDPSGAPRVRAGARLTVVIPTAAPILPSASLVTLGGVPLDAVDGAPTGPNTWSVVLTGEEGDGTKVLDARLVDAVGNTTRTRRADVAAVFDFQAPEVATAVLQRLPAFPPADDGSGTVWFRTTDPFSGATVRAALRLTTAEDLGAPPELIVTGPSADAWDAQTPTERLATWTLDAIPAVEGTTTFDVVLTDLVGNVSPPRRLDVEMIVDLTGELAAPDVDTPDRIVLDRAPWGAPVTASPDPRFTIEGGPGAVDARATVVARTRTGAFVGSEQADAQGAFAPIAAASDLVDVLVEQLDRAGNAGARVRVRDVIWRAALGDKVAGSLVDNPHFAREEPFATPGRRASAELRDPAALGAPDRAWLTEGAPEWRVAPTRDAPSPRLGHAAAFDPVHQQLVLFGGDDGATRADTWVRDAQGWRDVTPATGGPSPRTGHRMTWDPATQRVLLYGGGSNGMGGIGAETWAWTGQAWELLTPTTGSPTGHATHALAWDPVRVEVLAFGGYTGGGTFFPAIAGDETWRWDGHAWTLLGRLDPDGPTARSETAMAYDPVTERILLFGGRDSQGTELDDTWAWDGTAWTELETATTPVARYAHAMVFDPVHGELILHGGRAGTTRRADTWRWTGDDWEQVGLTPRPPTRGDTTVAFDPVLGQLVMFGGEGPPGLRGDTLKWDGARWQEIDPAPAPSVGAGDVAMAWDPVRQRAVLVGGRDGDDLAGTWTWDGSAWTDVGEGPPARDGFALGWDAAHDRLVLFGGVSPSFFPVFGDTWLWDGTAWTEASSGPDVSARFDTAMVFDHNADELILFGGIGEERWWADTWAWTGTAWVQRADGPPTMRDRYAHRLAWDPLGGSVVLFGGTEDNEFLFGLDETWTRADGAWTRASPEPHPPARLHHGMATLPDQQQVVVFGGAYQGTLRDTWMWRDGLWRDVSPRAGLPVPPSASAMAGDPVRGEVVLFAPAGANPGATWLLDGGRDARPAIDVAIDRTAARAPDAELRSVTVRATAGGLGYPEGTPTRGARLQVWDTWRWLDVDANATGRGSSSALCASFRADEAVRAEAECVDAVDPARLDRLFLGPDGARLHVRLTTVAPNGLGNPGVANRPYAAVTVDTVEVIVRYRLPGD